MRCDEIRLTGSGGANKVMEAELKRLALQDVDLTARTIQLSGTLP